MAEKHRMMWFQGKLPYVVPLCDGKYPDTCPQSKSIAVEYKRGYWTLTNVLVPNPRYEDRGVETTLKKELKEFKVGDYIWLVLVPPLHKVTDVFLRNDVTFTEGSSYLSFAGLGVDLVSAKFKAADENGECAMIDEQNHGSVTFPEGDDAKQQFLQADVNTINDTETWYGVGIKITALPAGKTLADFVGKIGVGVHAIDYQVQEFM